MALAKVELISHFPYQCIQQNGDAYTLKSGGFARPLAGMNLPNEENGVSASGQNYCLRRARSVCIQSKFVTVSRSSSLCRSLCGVPVLINRLCGIRCRTFVLCDCWEVQH